MLAGVGIAVCVGAVVAVWVAGALYNAPHNLHNASHAPRERIPRQPWTGALIVVAVVCAGLAVASRSHFDGLAVGTFWVQVFGLAVLVASTVFTLWARVLAWHQLERDAQGPGRSPAPYSRAVCSDTSSDLHRRTRDAARRHAAQRDRAVDRALPSRPDPVRGQDPHGRAFDAGDLPQRVPRVPPTSATACPGSLHTASTPLSQFVDRAASKFPLGVKRVAKHCQPEQLRSRDRER
jgi:hypothetical protein